MDSRLTDRHMGRTVTPETGPPVHIRLEKINHTRRQKRYYALRLSRTLFGEWCLQREWGVIGGAGQQKCDYLPAADLAEKELERLKSLKLKNGYAVIPVQLGMFAEA